MARSQRGQRGGAAAAARGKGESSFPYSETDTASCFTCRDELRGVRSPLNQTAGDQFAALSPESALLRAEDCQGDLPYNSPCMCVFTCFTSRPGRALLTDLGIPPATENSQKPGPPQPGLVLWIRRAPGRGRPGRGRRRRRHAHQHGRPERPPRGSAGPAPGRSGEPCSGYMWAKLYGSGFFLCYGRCPPKWFWARQGQVIAGAGETLQQVLRLRSESEVAAGTDVCNHKWSRRSALNPVCPHCLPCPWMKAGADLAAAAKDGPEPSKKLERAEEK